MGGVMGRSYHARFFCSGLRRATSGADFGQLGLRPSLALDGLELRAEAIERALRVTELSLRVAEMSAERSKRLAGLVEGAGEPRGGVGDDLRGRLDAETAPPHGCHLPGRVG